jgi:adenylate kinase
MNPVASSTADIAAPKPLPAVILIGAPGTGKGTQGSILNAVPGFWFVSMGEVLRAQRSELQTDAAIRDSMQAGQLVSTDVVFTAWRRHLSELTQDGLRAEDGLLVLDGLPRNIAQAERLQSQISLLRVIYLRCTDDDLLLQRISGRAAKSGTAKQRADDASLEVSRHRLRVFREETLPLLDWFAEEKISTVDATLQPLQVLQQIVEALLKTNTVPGAAITGCNPLRSSER